MSHAQVETQNPKANENSVKDQPLWTVPAILAILMLGSGGFFLMLAQGISILSKVNY